MVVCTACFGHLINVYIEVAAELSARFHPWVPPSVAALTLRHG